MDQALKQRLIGASILIALAVIFVPMLLDEPVQEDDTASLNIPPQPQAPVRTRRIPVPDDNVDEAVASDRPVPNNTPPPNRYPAPEPRNRNNPPASNTGSAADQIVQDVGVAMRRPDANNTANDNTSASTAAPSGATNTTPNNSANRSSSTDNTAAVAQNTPPANTADTSDEQSRQDTIINNSPPVATNAAASLLTPNENQASGRIPDDEWSLQVASFGAAENASRLAKRLREMGYNPNLDTVYRGGSPLHRVRVGPFSNQQAATAAGARISGDIPDLRPRPVAPQNETAKQVAASTTKPAPAAVSSTPVRNPSRNSEPRSVSDGLERFAVQLGSFAGSDNADRMQTRLRDAGYPAFVERVDREQGTRYLVKVGPLLSRNDATSTRDRIERELSVKGILVDYL
jgi:cell division septation protein DedD